MTMTISLIATLVALMSLCAVALRQDTRQRRIDHQLKTRWPLTIRWRSVRWSRNPGGSASRRKRC